MRPLSPRESEVLSLFDQGLELKEIAGRLGLSIHSVVTYAKRIAEKTFEADGKPCCSLRRAAWLRRQPNVPAADGSTLPHTPGAIQLRP